MYSEPLRDPRDEPLRPTAEEVDAWASREHKRREAWLAGPTRYEQDEWARRSRRNAAFGLTDSSLGPSDEEVEQWAEREHKRRQAWLAGPTNEERRNWAHRSSRRGFARFPESELLPTEEEIEEWAQQEHRRRQAWLAGPTEEEKQRWVHRETGALWEGVPGTMEDELTDSARRLLRDADLATKGSLDALFRAPLAIWSYFVRSGRRFEEDLYQPAPRRRVRF